MEIGLDPQTIVIIILKRLWCILILCKLKGLKSKFLLIPQLYFTIKECKIDLSVKIAVNKDAKRRVYGKNLAKKSRNILFPVLFYSVLATLMKRKSFVKDLFPVPANLHI